MNNSALLNGISSINSVVKSFRELQPEVSDGALLMQAAKHLIEDICTCNTSLCRLTQVSNSSEDGGLLLGECVLPDINTGSITGVLERYIPNLLRNDGSIRFPVSVHLDSSFTIVIEMDSWDDSASTLAQFILLSYLQQNEKTRFKCADMVRGGGFFSAVHSLITRFPDRTGGKVLTSDNEITNLLDQLDSDAAKVISLLGSSWNTLSEYNKAQIIKQPPQVNVLFLSQTYHAEEILRRIQRLSDNKDKTGISFIVIGSKDITSALANSADLYFSINNGRAYIGDAARIPFYFDKAVAIRSGVEDALADSMISAVKIDTHFKNHNELHGPLLTMDSTRVLRIPFALDENGIVQYFEIGGDAPPHALISGSTGSGKSVALHTLILQIIRNYHPDDVEIWAIDYKAVEFDGYIDHRTPHFRVIAHDTSEEFSYSLLDMLYEEYNERMNKFLSVGEKSIAGYRRKKGPHSMPRIVVFIDEFQILTQAVQEYTGSKDYRTVLENLLKLTRAMGISFVLCSQTIASGLSGLTESARDQIGCRLSLKHDDDNEIRESLTLSGYEASELISKAKNLRKGQAIYKRERMPDEYSQDGRSYEFKDVNILFFSDDDASQTIDQVNQELGNDFREKDEVFVRGGGRISIVEKRRHPIQKFIHGGYEPEDEIVEWYPAGPTTLADSFEVDLDNSEGANILLVGEDDDLRESVVVHSICGFLMNPENTVIASFIDEAYPDRARLIGHLRNIKSPRLKLCVGVSEVVDTITKLKRIRPVVGHTIYLWYGLDKLKNELFLLKQDEEESFEQTVPQSREEMMSDLMNFLSDLNSGDSTGHSVSGKIDFESVNFESCKSILLQAFEVGPENNHFHFAIFNSFKSLKKSGLIKLDSFEHRIGTRMSMDDSYDLFGSSLAINKADANTVIYYSGSERPIPLHPYLLPSPEWYVSFNTALAKQGE